VKTMAEKMNHARRQVMRGLSRAGKMAAKI
jgi:hypothetical protein